jgi:HME family heavy-metal exporter
VVVAVQKQPSASTVEVTRQVESALREISAGLPGGMRADRVQFRQATFIETSIGTLTTVLIEAAIVVAVVLFLFLLNTRTTAISLIALPVSMLTTALVFQSFGLSINTMTLGGIAIAIGELVDDAVVDVENVYRRLRENAGAATPQPVLAVVAHATGEVRSGIVYATAIIVLVFLPLFFLGGVEGRLFQPLGIAYIVSILASFVTAITLTPVLCSYLLPGIAAKRGERESGLVRGLKTGNRRLLEWGFRHTRPIFAASIAVSLVAIVGAVALPRAFLPTFNEGSFVVNLLLEPGVSLQQSSELGSAAEKLVLSVPEVASVSRRTGRAELDEHAEGVHYTELDVALKSREADRDAVAAAMRAKLAILPGSVSIGAPIGHRLDHLLSGVQAQIVVKIFAEDLAAARPGRTAARAGGGRAGPGRSARRKAGARAAARSAHRLRARCRLRHHSGRCRCGSRDPVQWREGRPGRRWSAPLGRRAAPARRAANDRATRQPAGRDAARPRSAHQHGRNTRNGRPEPDFARGWEAPHRRLGQRRAWRRPGRHRRGDRGRGRQA